MHAAMFGRESKVQRKPRHVFIAGAPRCGTTTLFDVLARHPDVAPCRVKEPNFLIPESFPMKGFRFLRPGDGRARFDALFDREAQVRLEASATYLYAPGIAERIRDEFAGARVVLILRDPVPRFVSEYRFAKMMRVIPHTTTADEYLQLLRRQNLPHEQREPEHRALGNGRYSEFVARYIAALGRDRVHVTWTESLGSDAEATMHEICEFIGIDPRPLHGACGAQSNRSREIAHPRLYALYFALGRWRQRGLAEGRHETLSRLSRRFLGKPLYRLATAPAREDGLSAKGRRSLEAFYAQEPQRLEAMLGEHPPWARR